MAGALTIANLPYQCGAAVTKLRFVKLSGAQTVILVAASTDRSLGVIQVDMTTAEAASGKQGSVMVHGVSWVEAGAAVALNARVMSDTTGRGITAATATNIPTGLALSAAGAAGDLFLVLLTPNLPAL